MNAVGMIMQPFEMEQANGGAPNKAFKQTCRIGASLKIAVASKRWRDLLVVFGRPA
jgi:hypothetical protein